MSKISVSWAAGVLAAMILVGCGGSSGSGGGGGDDPSFGPIAGTWRATSLTGGGPDTPCPTTFAVSNTSAGSLSRFGCGSGDTLIFNTDGTFTGTKTPVEGETTPYAQTFSGRWAQFQLRVLLTVDNGAAFPYGTTIEFRNRDRFTLPAANLSSINRFIFTRQQSAQ